MNSTRETVRHALKFLAVKGRVTDDELGQMLGKSRQTGWAKRHGTSRITWDDFDMLVAGFGVDKTVFLMDLPDLEKWYEKTRWGGPKRPIVTIDLREVTTSCDFVLQANDLRLFDPNEPPDVIDLRERILNQTAQKDSLDLYAKTG